MWLRSLHPRAAGARRPEVAWGVQLSEWHLAGPTLVAVDPMVQGEVLRAVREIHLLHADETSWKEASRLLWLWVFTCAIATLFVVGQRSREALDRVLAPTFAYRLMSDGCWACRDYDWRLRCLAHLVL